MRLFGVHLRLLFGPIDKFLIKFGVRLRKLYNYCVILRCLCMFPFGLINHCKAVKSIYLVWVVLQQRAAGGFRFIELTCGDKINNAIG